MKKISISLWGLGNHAINRILPALESIEELSIMGVCSRNKEKVFETAKKYNCMGWTNPKEMLNDANIDIIYIAAPIGVHFNLVEQALKAGKNVWCEKPLTCNYNNTKALILLAERNKLMLAEAFMYLYHPQFKKIKNLVQDKDNNFGKVKSVICRFGIPNLENPGFRNDPDLCGGAFWDVASYTVSAVLELFPLQNAKLLFAEVNKQLESPVDTDGRAIIRFSNDVTAYLEWSVGVGYKNEIDLWSDNGSFYTDKIFSKPENYQPIYRIRDQKGNEFLEEGQKSEQIEVMLREFSKILNSTDRIKREHIRILELAKVMDQIVRFDL